MDKIVKSFTITGGAFAACLVLGKIFQNSDSKRKNQALMRELELEHDIQAAEIKKNGKVSEETLERVTRLQKKL